MDPWQPQGDTGFVPRTLMHAVEGNLNHQPLLSTMCNLTHRTEAIGGVIAHKLVELLQLLVGKAEIGLADRHQFQSSRAIITPGPESIVGIEG